MGKAKLRLWFSKLHIKSGGATYLRNDMLPSISYSSSSASSPEAGGDGDRRHSQQLHNVLLLTPVRSSRNANIVQSMSYHVPPCSASGAAFSPISPLRLRPAAAQALMMLRSPARPSPVGKAIASSSPSASPRPRDSKHSRHGSCRSSVPVDCGCASFSRMSRYQAMAQQEQWNDSSAVCKKMGGGAALKWKKKKRKKKKKKGACAAEMASAGYGEDDNNDHDRRRQQDYGADSAAASRSVDRNLRLLQPPDIKPKPSSKNLLRSLSILSKDCRGSDSHPLLWDSSVTSEETFFSSFDRDRHRRSFSSNSSSSDGIKQSSSGISISTDGIKQSSVAAIAADGIKQSSSFAIPRTDGIKQNSIFAIPSTDGIKQKSSSFAIPRTDGIKQNSSSFAIATDRITQSSSFAIATDRITQSKSAIAADRITQSDSFVAAAASSSDRIRQSDVFAADGMSVDRHLRQANHDASHLLRQLSSSITTRHAPKTPSPLSSKLLRRDSSSALAEAHDSRLSAAANRSNYAAEIKEDLRNDGYFNAGHRYTDDPSFRQNVRQYAENYSDGTMAPLAVFGGGNQNTPLTAGFSGHKQSFSTRSAQYRQCEEDDDDDDRKLWSMAMEDSTVPKRPQSSALYRNLMGSKLSNGGGGAQKHQSHCKSPSDDMELYNSLQMRWKMMGEKQEEARESSSGDEEEEWGRRAAGYHGIAAGCHGSAAGCASGGGCRWRVAESLAVVKSSSDPLIDFRDSMVDMILENDICSAEDMEELLRCFLSLNSPDHHATIVAAFAHVWQAVFDE